MFRKYLIPFLAIAGFTFAVKTVMTGNQPVPIAPAVAPPAQAPYRSFVAGAGIIEASSENIAIGTPIAGVVTQVFARVGDNVKANDPLFQLDDRDLQADWLVKKAAIKASEAKLERLLATPRPEDIPPLEAKVKEEEASLADLKNQLTLWESVTDKRAISADELSRKRFAVQVEEARLLAARALLAQLKAGSWKKDIEVARADLESARAQAQATEIQIARLTVRAPISGQIFQVKIHRGEFASAGVLQTPLMMIGNVDLLNVRVDVDEHEAWRVRSDGKAIAFVRGNNHIKTPLQFVRIEPYIVPKKSLTGDSTERVDTRVLQALYSFERGGLPVYLGQQMDVFIEAPAPMLNDASSTITPNV